MHVDASHADDQVDYTYCAEQTILCKRRWGHIAFSFVAKAIAHPLAVFDPHWSSMTSAGARPLRE
ncbi:MAG: hypothetical protein WBW74_27495 [Xanthobacteraceae bacterium]